MFSPARFSGGTPNSQELSMSRLMLAIRGPVAALLAVTYLSGCGVIIHGTRQQVAANSTPAAAKVTTSPSTGEYQTPITLSLERKKSYTVRFERDGYSPATVEIRNGLSIPIVVIDVLLGLVPLVIDAATGAWYKLTPGTALVVMTRLAQVDGPERIWIGLNGRAGTGEVNLTSTLEGVRVHVEAR
jgi:hypothetical protein